MGRSDFAKYTKKLRTKAGVSQAEVADVLNLKSGQLISNWERGQCYPPLRTLKQLSALYKVGLKDLFNKYSFFIKDDMWAEISSGKK